MNTTNVTTTVSTSEEVEEILFKDTNLSIEVLWTLERLKKFGNTPNIRTWLDTPTGISIQTLPINGERADNGIFTRFLVDNSVGNSGVILISK